MQLGSGSWTPLTLFPKPPVRQSRVPQNAVPTNYPQEPLTCSWFQWSHSCDSPVRTEIPAELDVFAYPIWPVLVTDTHLNRVLQSFICSSVILFTPFNAFSVSWILLIKTLVILYFRQICSSHITSPPVIFLFLVHSIRFLVMLNAIQVKACKFICCGANWCFMNQN